MEASKYSVLAGGYITSIQPIKAAVGSEECVEVEVMGTDGKIRTFTETNSEKITALYGEVGIKV